MARFRITAALIAAAWLSLAAQSGLAAAPKVFPERDFPSQSPEERPLAKAYFDAADTDDLARQEATARAWLTYRAALGPGPEAWFQAFILERLGLAQGQQGKAPEALESFSRAYALYSDAFGADSPEARDVGSMLAISQFKLGRMAEARATIRAVSKASDEADGPDSDRALNALRTWAQTSGNSDQMSEAADLWGELAARRLRRFGPQDPEMADAEYFQAVKLIQGERAREALAVLARVIPRYERQKGADSSEALGARSWEASALLSAGRAIDAEAKARAVMTASRRALGPKADPTLLSEETYLRALIAQGAYDRAPEVFSDLMKARLDTFGEDGATLDLAEIGADLFEQMDQFSAAEPLRRTAWAASIKAHGVNSDHALERLNALADLLRRADRTTEAEALLLPVWTGIGPTAKGEVELDLGLTLAAVYIFQERYADAERLLRDLSDRSTRFLGPRRALTLSINNNLGIVIANRGRMTEAEALHRETWAGWKAVRGPAHPTTILSGLQVAKAITDPTRIQERITLITELDQTLEAARQTRAASSAQMAILTTMAKEASRYGMYEAAAVLWDQIQKGYLQLFGPDNRRTRDATLALARALGEQGKHAQAEPLFASLVASEERIAGPEGPPSSGWVVAEAGLGLSRTLQGRASGGYPNLQRAAEAVYARSADRRATGTGADARRQVLVESRYIFNGLMRSGWAFAHEP